MWYQPIDIGYIAAEIEGVCKADARELARRCVASDAAGSLAEVATVQWDAPDHIPAPPHCVALR